VRASQPADERLARARRQDLNGETGTVSAGNYAKGDSVSLYVTAMPEGESGSKKFYTNLLQQAVTQKGAEIQARARAN
jgi:hypothetical protein